MAGDGLAELLDLRFQRVARPGVGSGAPAAAGGLDRADRSLQPAGQVAVVEPELAEQAIQRGPGGGGPGLVLAQGQRLAGEAAGRGPLLEDGPDLGRLEVARAVVGQAVAGEAGGQVQAGLVLLLLGRVERLDGRTLPRAADLGVGGGGVGDDGVAPLAGGFQRGAAAALLPVEPGVGVAVDGGVQSLPVAGLHDVVDATQVEAQPGPGVGGAQRHLLLALCGGQLLAGDGQQPPPEGAGADQHRDADQHGDGVAAEQGADGEKGRAEDAGPEAPVDLPLAADHLAVGQLDLRLGVRVGLVVAVGQLGLVGGAGLDGRVVGRPELVLVQLGELVDDAVAGIGGRVLGGGQCGRARGGDLHGGVDRGHLGVEVLGQVVGGGRHPGQVGVAHVGHGAQRLTQLGGVGAGLGPRGGGGSGRGVVRSLQPALETARRGRG
ncbi:MAG: hypothetical protein J0I64_00320, partial [Devosia sp.]|nr:hypothetical protein [Devosia sp.]